MIEKTLGFHPNARFNLDKLIVGGHSFGGMSSVYSAFREKRVKAVFGFDAWVWAVLSKVYAAKFIVRQP